MTTTKTGQGNVKLIEFNDGELVVDRCYGEIFQWKQKRDGLAQEITPKRFRRAKLKERIQLAKSNLTVMNIEIKDKMNPPRLNL